MAFQSDSDRTEQKILDLALDDGLWFRMPYIFIRKLPWAQAVMLAFLIGQSYRLRTHERRKGRGREWRGWFYCTTKHVQKLFRILPRSQQLIFKELRELGLIKHSLRGVPPRRYFKIDKIKLMEFLVAK